MHKLRLALVLPVIQFAIAAILLQWAYRAPIPRGSEAYVPTVRLVCRGLNAPALLFRMLDPFRLGPPFDSGPRSMLGFDRDDLFFLVGVIVAWYLVGRALDHRRSSSIAARKRIANALIAYPLLLALGVLLLFLGMHDVQNPGYENLDPPFGAWLTLMWSASLIFLSGRGLVRAIREHRRTRPQPAQSGG
jgi:hypothetical protein